MNKEVEGTALLAKTIKYGWRNRFKAYTNRKVTISRTIDPQLVIVSIIGKDHKLYGLTVSTQLLRKIKWDEPPIYHSTASVETKTGALHKSAGFPGTNQAAAFNGEKINEPVSQLGEQSGPQDRDNGPVLGMRHNQGKLKWSLIDYPSMEGMVRVLEKGAIKYAPYNWQKGLKFTEMLESMQRHTAALMAGEDIDSETGEFHEDLIHCNAMFLSWMRKHRPDMDDRNRYPDYPKKLLSEL